MGPAGNRKRRKATVKIRKNSSKIKKNIALDEDIFSLAKLILLYLQKL